MVSSPTPYIALVGVPNSGKTSLFNALTGTRQKVGNYPGVTVERKEGFLKTLSNQGSRILDLPGTYSLNPSSFDERVTCQVLQGESFKQEKPQLILAVVDATNLERGLSFVLELQALQLPMVVALNMMDLARARKSTLSVENLQKELRVPVVPVVATKGEGVRELIETIEKALVQDSMPKRHPRAGVDPVSGSEPLDSRLRGDDDGSPKEKLKSRYQEIDRILTASQAKPLEPAHWTHRIDQVVLHPFWGTLLLYTILALVFQAIFNWATTPMDFIEGGIEGLGNQVSDWLPEGVLRSLIVDGAIAGVGSVVIFLPQILFLFFIILLLEDSGYMARAAFLMDKHMSRVGLHGRAFIPLLSSFACAIPGIMATRTIENKRDRMITILISPLMACSARIPVYTLLIAAFIPNLVIWGPIRLQGLVMLGLYLGGLLVALGFAWVFKKTLFTGPEPTFVLELPTYKWPSWRNVFYGMLERAKVFLKRAGTIILVASVLVWIFSSYPKAPEGVSESKNPIEYSWAGQAGKAMEPFIKPLGYDWSIGVGLLTGVVAREVIVGTLATLYSVEAEDEEVSRSALGELIQKRWSLATGLSLLVFFVFAMQCLSTLAVVRRETNSWKYPALMFGYMTVLAYGAAFVTYRLILLL